MTIAEIISRLKDVTNQFGSGMFNLDEETEEEMLECGAIDNEVEEMEKGVDEAIKFLEIIDEKLNINRHILELIDTIEERVIFSDCSDKANLSEYKNLVNNIRLKIKSKGELK